ncbi:36231_t:CDS:1, partial [Gigaspora margarita]
ESKLEIGNLLKKYNKFKKVKIEKHIAEEVPLSSKKNSLYDSKDFTRLANNKGYK